MASSSYRAGTYGAIGNPLQCAGNATKWNVCYYPTANSTSASATLAVYRKYFTNYYFAVFTSPIAVNISGSTNPSYTCTSFPVNQAYSIQQGDILVGCIPSQSGLNMAANIIGTSVYYYSAQYCGISGPLSSNQPSGLTLLVSLGTYTGIDFYSTFTAYVSDVDECAVRNGGCGQICNDTTPGYFCNCRPGYGLDQSGVNCTSLCMLSFIVQ